MSTLSSCSGVGVDVHLAFLALERLEVAELVQAANAVLQRLAVEDAAFGDAHLAPDHGVMRRRVAHERDAVHEELLAFVHLDVMSMIGGGGSGPIGLPVAGSMPRGFSSGSGVHWQYPNAP